MQTQVFVGLYARVNFYSFFVCCPQLVEFGCWYCAVDCLETLVS